MMVHNLSLIIHTRPKGIINITNTVNESIERNKLESGVCSLFVKHTSCSLIISENCDPDVLSDLESFMSDLVKEDKCYKHHAEGRDDMPAHIRSVLTQTSLTIPIANGKLALGTWQAIYLWEHRAYAHQREVICSIIFSVPVA